jgi:integrase
LSASVQLLTDTILNKKKVPAGEGVWIADTACPGLRVRISTTKKNARNAVFYYRYRHRETKKLIPVRLGQYPGLSLDGARQLLKNELRERVDSGEDIRKYLKQRNQAKQTAEEEIISSLVHRFIGHLHKRNRASSTITTYSRYLRAVVHEWGGKHPNEITRGDAEDLFDLVKENGVPATDLYGKSITNRSKVKRKGGHRAAGHLLSAGQAFFKWCLDRELVSSNPWAGREKLREESNSNISNRVLTDEELAQVFEKLDLLSARDSVVVQLLLATGLRPGEVCAAKWDEIDLESGQWLIPGQRMKYKNADHLVFLPTKVLKLLKTWRRSDRVKSSYVFASVGGKSPCLTVDHLGESFKKLKIEGFTPKVCRATVRTGLQKLGCPEEVRSRISHHQRGDRVSRSYDHYSFDGEAKKWWEVWFEHLLKIRSNEETVLSSLC